MNRDDRWPKANTKTTASDKASRRDRLLRRSETGSYSGYSRDFTGTDLPMTRFSQFDDILNGTLIPEVPWLQIIECGA
jgi:hypothetical protein